jgi:magnesium chelatase family protein
MAKISGPLLDRIDMHIEVPSVEFKELASKQAGTPSEEMRDQVVSARQTQTERFANSRINCNAQMNSRQVRQFCELDKASQALLRDSVNEMGLSARAHDKVLRLSRTIADLEPASSIGPHHIQEAVNYRMLDRQFWT